MFINGDRADQILRFLLRSTPPSVGPAESKRDSKLSEKPGSDLRSGTGKDASLDRYLESKERSCGRRKHDVWGFAE